MFAFARASDAERERYISFSFHKRRKSGSHTQILFSREQFLVGVDTYPPPINRSYFVIYLIDLFCYQIDKLFNCVAAGHMRSFLIADRAVYYIIYNL